jgi:hypothetical protein
MNVEKVVRVVLLALCLAGAGCPSDSPSEESAGGTSGNAGEGRAGSGGSSGGDEVSDLLEQLADVSYEADLAACECAEEGDEDCPAERISAARFECMKQQVLAYEDQAKIKAEIECFIESTEQTAACLEESSCDEIESCDGRECTDEAWETIDDCD